MRIYAAQAFFLLFMASVSSVALSADLTSNEMTEGQYNKTDKSGRFDPPAESIEFDNGMIVKWGNDTIAAGALSATVTFDARFPDGILSVEATPQGDSAIDGITISVRSFDQDGFIMDRQCADAFGLLINCTRATDIRWSARGY